MLMRATSSPVPHAWVPEGLDEGNVWTELFNPLLDFLGHIQTAHRALNGGEVLDALVDGPVRIVDIVGQQLSINVDQGVVHPGLVPLQPVGRG